MVALTYVLHDVNIHLCLIPLLHCSSIVQSNAYGYLCHSFVMRFRPAKLPNNDELQYDFAPCCTLALSHPALYPVNFFHEFPFHAGLGIFMPYFYSCRIVISPITFVNCELLLPARRPQRALTATHKKTGDSFVLGYLFNTLPHSIYGVRPVIWLLSSSYSCAQKLG